MGRRGRRRGRAARRRAGPEAAPGAGDRRAAARLPHGVRDARRGGLHARGDRRGPRRRDGDVEGTTVAGARPATGIVGRLRGRVGLMTDERFERLLREAAQDYHRPPATPREAMWQGTAARRAARRRRAATWRPVLRWGVGIAAVLALGVAIGRWAAEPPRTRPAPVAAARGGDPGPLRDPAPAAQAP